MTNELNPITQSFRKALRDSWQGLTTADPSTFDDLMGNEPLANIALHVPSIVEIVACLSGYCNDGAAPESFPLSAEGLPWLERYLTQCVKPFVLKFDERPVPIKVKRMPNSTSAETLSSLKYQLTWVSYVLGQCLAQQLKLRWRQSSTLPSPFGELYPTNDSPMIGTVDPHQAPFKFVAFGAQDSLVSFNTLLSKQKDSQALVERVIKDCYEVNPQLANSKTLQPQVLYDRVTGMPFEIIIRDNGRVIHRARLEYGAKSSAKQAY